jgi:hypothetical protein
MPKCEFGTAKVLVDKFEARLRAQCRQMGRTWTGEAASIESRQAGNCRSRRNGRDATEKGPRKRGRRRPWKQV